MMTTTDLDPRKGLKGRKTKVLHREVFFKGQDIVEQGDEGYRAYYIERGRVGVFMHDGKHELKVAEMGPGDLFGEMALITHGARTATVRAIDDCTLTIITRDEVEGKIKRIDDVAIRALINVLAERLRRTTRQQFDQYLGIAELQDRIAGVVDSVDLELDEKDRETFREEVTPLLNNLQTILDKYKK